MQHPTVVIEMAGAPMGKERVRVTRAGHAYTPERTLNYESRLASHGQAAMAGRPPLTGPLSVLVEAFMPIAESKPQKWKSAARTGQIRPVKKPDWDNFGKILDALNLIVWVDDSQIIDGRVLKWFDDRPRLVVTVCELQPEGAFG